MNRNLISLLLMLSLLVGCAQTGPKIPEASNNNNQHAEVANIKQAMLEKARTFRKSHTELFGEANGVLVAEIVPNSQGEKAALQPEDILLTYDGIPLNSMEHLIQLTGEKSEDNLVTLTYLRSKELRKVDIQGGRIGLLIMTLSESEIFTSRLAVFPFQNQTGDQTLDWVSIALQESLNIDLWYLPLGWVEPLPSLTADIKEKCPNMTTACVASINRETWLEIAKNRDYQHIVWGQYSQYGDRLNIEFFLLDIKNETIVANHELVASLEQFTEHSSESLLKFMGALNVNLSAEQKQRVKRPETNNVIALKNNALGFWAQQQHNVSDTDKEKQIQAESWQAYLQKATKADPSYANAWNNFGWYYLVLNNEEQAKQTFYHALEANPQHPDALDGLANIYQSQNDLSNASIVLEQLAKISPSMPFLSLKLADLYMQIGEYEKAKSYYEHMLATLKQTYGSENLYSVRILLSLANSHLSLYNATESMIYIEKALIIQEKMLGPEHVEVAKGLTYLVSMHAQSGEFEKAKPLQERILSIQEKNYGLVHVEVAQSLFNLANINRALGKLGKAKNFFKQALSIQEKVYEPFHKEIARSHNSLGTTYLALGDFEKSRLHLERSLAIQKEIHGSEHVTVAKNLYDLGVVNQINNFKKAKNNFEQSLAIYEKLLGPEHELVAKGLDKTARMYFLYNYLEKAKNNFERALAINKEVFGQNSIAVAKNLEGLASIYKRFDEFEQAEELYKHALSIHEKVYGPDEINTINGIHDLAKLYLELDEYAKAKPLFERTLAIIDKNNDLDQNDFISVMMKHFKPLDSVFILADLADLYMHLGETERALQLLEPLPQKIAEIFGEEHLFAHTVFLKVGYLYSVIGNYAQAKSLIKNALTSQKQIFGPNDPVVATSLAYLGGVHFNLKEYAKAKTLLERSLDISEKTLDWDHTVVAYRHNDLASIYLKLGEYKPAEQHLNRALLIAQSVQRPEILASVQGNFRQLFARLQKPEEAILFGKIAINTLQAHRGRLKTLEESLQKSFLAKVSEHYHSLADILIEQGRLAEAEQVMAMLKEEEYFNFIQRDGKDDMRTTQASYTQVEKAIATELDQFSSQLVILGKEYESLQKLSQTDEQAKVRLIEVEKELEQAQDSFLKLLSGLDNYFKQTSGEKALEFGERQLAQLERQQDLLGKHQAVIITTVTTKDKLHLLLTTPNVQLARESSIGEKDLNDLIKRFRNALKHPGSDPLPLAQELYTHLVKPLEKDLQQTQSKTLMWSLDGALRYVPLATLHDGQQYLIEKYGLSLYTAAAHNNLHENNVSAWRVAGLGVSLAHAGFDALPAVPNELRSIIRQNDDDQIGVLPGEIHLDQAFNRETFKSMVRAGYPVLHIASHFKLQPGNGSASKLLLGDGTTLSLDEFRRKPAFKLHGVDLLTLSACDTAVGDKGAGGEIESFAVMAQLRGANGVLASLWRVEDESTALLMKQLYQLRSADTHLSKAEALRQAQIKLLRGDKNSNKKGQNFSHPYFWAPFVMMGNWL